MKLGIGIGIDVSKKPLDTTPAIPETLTITGITDPADSDPLVLTRITDLNNYPQWELIDGDIYGYVWWENGNWLILYNNTVDTYDALIVSDASTPVGLIGWTVTMGSGEPSLVGS